MNFMRFLKIGWKVLAGHSFYLLVFMMFWFLQFQKSEPLHACKRQIKGLEVPAICISSSYFYRYL